MSDFRILVSRFPSGDMNWLQRLMLDVLDWAIHNLGQLVWDVGALEVLKLWHVFGKPFGAEGLPAARSQVLCRVLDWAVIHARLAHVSYVSFQFKSPAFLLNDIYSLLTVILAVKHSIDAHLLFVILDIVFTRDICIVRKHADALAAISFAHQDLSHRLRHFFQITEARILHLHQLLDLLRLFVAHWIFIVIFSFDSLFEYLDLICSLL